MGAPNRRSLETLSAIKYKNIDIAATGATQLIAAVAGAKIRVLSMFISCDNATNLSIQDDAGSPVTLLGGTRVVRMSEGAEALLKSLTLPYNEGGWFETSAGQDLDVVLTGVGSAICGCISYVEATP